MLKIEGLSKRMEGFTLDNIRFHLPKGYIMGLIGENGAGKTTLINCILNLYQWNTGSIIIDGMEYKEQEKNIKNKIGYVLAEEIFKGEITVSEVGDLYGKYYEKYNRNIFLDYCRRFQLEEKKKCKTLSTGEGRKLQFAFALAHEPKLLILDEPTGNFDPEFRKEFFTILAEFISDGEKSVLLATHMTEELDRMADYITFLHKGKVLFSSEKRTIEESYMLISGEDYQINLLPKEEVIYKEKNRYGTRALCRERRRYLNKKELTIEIPTLEELMYFMLKGESTV